MVNLVRNGDMSAFRLLVDRHKNYAYTIANRIVNAPEVAEEIVQDSFMKLYKAASSFKGDSKFTTWFYRVVYNTAISSGRKNRIKTSNIDDEPTSFGGSDNQNELLSEDRQQFINLALEQLSDEDKLIITLFYFEELTLEEIAEVISQDRNNLKVKLFRARKKLALELNNILKGEAASLL